MSNLIIEENPFHFRKSHKQTGIPANIFSFNLNKDGNIVNASSLFDSSNEETFFYFFFPSFSRTAVLTLIQGIMIRITVDSNCSMCPEGGSSL